MTANSRAVSTKEHNDDQHYTDVQAWAATIGDRLKTFAPIRIDARRQVPGGPFYMFDINMKPVSLVVERVTIDESAYTTRHRTRLVLEDPAGKIRRPSS